MDFKDMFVKCQCGEHIVEIKKWVYKDHDEATNYNISFFTNKFYSGQEKFTLWNKLKLIWKVLRHGDYFLFDIELDENDFKNMHNKIHELLDFEYEDKDIVETEEELKGYWRCNNCGVIKYKEEEVTCLRCGEGQMIYHEYPF